MNPYFILGAVIAVGVAGAGGLYQGHKFGKAEVQQQWDKEKAAQYAEYAKGQEEARRREQELQANADQLRREKDAEIRNVNARATALSNSLQHRQSRSEADSLSSSSGARQTSCSGKELYREDGQFLVRLAGEADELRTALKQCYSQYEALRK